VLDSVEQRRIGILSQNLPECDEEKHKTLVRIVGVPAEDRIEYLLEKSITLRYLFNPQQLQYKKRIRSHVKKQNLCT
jgi:hypothetical protein